MGIYYRTKVVVSEKEAIDIEQDTRYQRNSDLWKIECYKLTHNSISKQVEYVKMYNHEDKTNDKVKALLYSKSRGNQGTRCGRDMETREFVLLTKQSKVSQV